MVFVSVSVIFYLTLWTSLESPPSLLKKRTKKNPRKTGPLAVFVFIYSSSQYFKMCNWTVNTGKLSSVTQCELIKAGEVTWVNNATGYPGGARDLINKEITCHSEEGHCAWVGTLGFFFLTIYTFITIFDVQYICASLTNKVLLMHDVLLLSQLRNEPPRWLDVASHLVFLT